MNQTPLQTAAQAATIKWKDYPPLVQASYDTLMTNEDFWEYPGHYTFTRVPGWHLLGSA